MFVHVYTTLPIKILVSHVEFYLYFIKIKFKKKTENHHQLPGWNSAPVYCWRPVDQMAEVGERDCYMMYSFGGTVHYGNEPADQCCPTRDERTKDGIRDLSPI